MTDEDRTAWVKIKEFIKAHPELLYKGVPIVLVGYLTLPLLISIWMWLPWLWAGYEVYRYIPPGSMTAFWVALKACKYAM